jgi:hypothetical protein
VQREDGKQGPLFLAWQVDVPTGGPPQLEAPEERELRDRHGEALL